MRHRDALAVVATARTPQRTADGRLLGVVLLVGVDDPPDQPVPHDVLAGQHREVHVLDAVEDVAHDLAAR